MTFVLDNSVAKRWCFNEGHPYADPILEKLETGDAGIVPAMWLYEASAVLAQAQLRSIITAPALVADASGVGEGGGVRRRAANAEHPA